jgi:nicotinate-nucleotide adenylyltransferase
MTNGAIGVFGGTFDPIHLGHLAAAEEAAYQLDLDRVLFVPNRIPPHKQERAISPAANRVAMVRPAIADNPQFELSTIELERPGPSYALDTMRELRRRFPDSPLVFLSGYDVLSSLHAWHEPESLLEEFELALLQRPGEEGSWATAESHFPGIRERLRIVTIPLLEISSRDIRRRVAEGRPFRYYVPSAVALYIDAHGLYRELRSGT